MLDSLWLLIQVATVGMLCWWASQVFPRDRGPAPLPERLRRAAVGLAISAAGIVVVTWVRRSESVPPAADLLLVLGAAAAPFGLWVSFRALTEPPRPRTLALWFRGLGLALTAGMAPDDALAALERDPALERLARFTAFLRNCLARGLGLAEAFPLTARATPGLRLGPIGERYLRHAEENGTVAAACLELAAYLAAREDDFAPLAPKPSEPPAGEATGLVTDDADHYALSLMRELVAVGARSATIAVRSDQAVVTYRLGREERVFGSSADPSLGRMPLTVPLGRRLLRVLLWQAGIPYWQREDAAGALTLRVDGKPVAITLARRRLPWGEEVLLTLPEPASLLADTPAEARPDASASVETSAS